jgi:hypothetical protein
VTSEAQASSGRSALRSQIPDSELSSALPVDANEADAQPRIFTNESESFLPLLVAAFPVGFYPAGALCEMCVLQITGLS